MGQKAIKAGDVVEEGDGGYTYRDGEPVAPAPLPSNGVEEALKASRPNKRRRTTETSRVEDEGNETDV